MGTERLAEGAVCCELVSGSPYRIRRADRSALVTHRFKLDDIEAAYDFFASQRDGVLKVAITP